MPVIDYYEVLGLKKTASQDDIKRAYRKLARKFHPDVTSEPGAAEKFEQAAQAYEVLRDPEKRTAYDQHGADWENPPQPDHGPSWNGGYDFRREDVTEQDPDAFRQFFENAFGRREGFGAHQSQLTVDLQDIMKGADKTVSLQMPHVAPDGRVSMRTKTLQVHIPKGVMPGQKLIVRRQGVEGVDLILEVQVRPHPTFRIDGRDLIVDLPVTPWEAALGTSIEMPTPTGRVRITVPAHARSGQRLRLKGKGLPVAGNGDLYAQLVIVNPPIKTDQARALYKKMAEEFDFDPRSKMKG